MLEEACPSPWISSRQSPLPPSGSSSSGLSPSLPASSGTISSSSGGPFKWGHPASFGTPLISATTSRCTGVIALTGSCGESCVAARGVRDLAVGGGSKNGLAFLGGPRLDGLDGTSMALVGRGGGPGGGGEKASREFGLEAVGGLRGGSNALCTFGFRRDDCEGDLLGGPLGGARGAETAYPDDSGSVYVG